MEENDTKKMTIHLRISDTTFVPKRSLRNASAIAKHAKREHNIDQYIGEGEQTFRWLVLAARERLLALYNINKGKLRHREATVGIPGAFIPNKVRSEDPETDNEMLKGSTILNTVLRNGDTIWIEFNQDGGKVTKWENETFYQTHGKDFVEERDTYELVEDEDDEPEIADEEFYNSRTPKVKTVKKERRRSFFLEKAVESKFKAFYETKQTYRRCFKVDWKKVKS